VEYEEEQMEMNRGLCGAWDMVQFNVAKARTVHEEEKAHKLREMNEHANQVWEWWVRRPGQDTNIDSRGLRRARLEESLLHGQGDMQLACLHRPQAFTKS